MHNVKLLTTFILLIIFCFAMSAKNKKSSNDDERFVSLIVDPTEENVQMFWKNDKQEKFKSLQQLKFWLTKQHKTLLFAMNGGMYDQDNSPLGLYIEKGKMLAPINRRFGNGNFYMEPNGIFYVDVKGTVAISKREKFVNAGNIQYATQSGPMLLTDGTINPLFKEGSMNVHIRNAVGILPNNNILFAMSKKEINFFDLAQYFKKMGCKDALYLDGFVSRTYLPAKNWIQTDGNFGVIIAVVKE